MTSPAGCSAQESRKLAEEERARRWREENREAIESQNAFYDRYGTLSEAILDLDDPAS